MNRHRYFQKLVLGLLVTVALVSCGGDRNSNAIHDATAELRSASQRLGHTSDKLDKTMEDMYNAFLKGDLLKARREALESLLNAVGMPRKISEATNYLLSFEFQVWSAQAENSLQARQAVAADAMREFLSDIQDFIIEERPIPRPLARGERHKNDRGNRTRCLNAIAIALHAVHPRQNEILRSFPGIQQFTMLSMLKDALSVRNRRDAGERRGGDDAPYIKEVLVYKDLAIHLLQARYNALGLFALRRLVRSGRSASAEPNPTSSPEGPVMTPDPEMNDEGDSEPDSAPRSQASLSSDSEETPRSPLGKPSLSATPADPVSKSKPKAKPKPTRNRHPSAPAFVDIDLSIYSLDEVKDFSRLLQGALQAYDFLLGIGVQPLLDGAVHELFDALKVKLSPDALEGQSSVGSEKLLAEAELFANVKNFKLTSKQAKILPARARARDRDRDRDPWIDQEQNGPGQNQEGQNDDWIDQDDMEQDNTGRNDNCKKTGGGRAGDSYSDGYDDRYEDGYDEGYDGGYEDPYADDYGSDSETVDDTASTDKCYGDRTDKNKDKNKNQDQENGNDGIDDEFESEDKKR